MAEQAQEEEGEIQRSHLHIHNVFTHASSNTHTNSLIFLQAADAKTAWKGLDKKEKKKWTEKLEPKRQKYIEVGITLFNRNGV